MSPSPTNGRDVWSIGDCASAPAGRLLFTPSATRPAFKVVLVILSMALAAGLWRFRLRPDVRFAGVLALGVVTCGVAAIGIAVPDGSPENWSMLGYVPDIVASAVLVPFVGIVAFAVWVFVIAQIGLALPTGRPGAAAGSGSSTP